MGSEGTDEIVVYAICFVVYVMASFSLKRDERVKSAASTSTQMFTWNNRN